MLKRFLLLLKKVVPSAHASQKERLVSIEHVYPSVPKGAFEYHVVKRLHVREFQCADASRACQVVT